MYRVPLRRIWPVVLLWLGVPGAMAQIVDPMDPGSRVDLRTTERAEREITQALRIFQNETESIVRRMEALEVLVRHGARAVQAVPTLVAELEKRKQYIEQIEGPDPISVPTRRRMATLPLPEAPPPVKSDGG